MRRPLLLLLAGVATVLPFTPSATASEAEGACPPAFEGPLTPAAIVEAYPPPPGIPDPTGALIALDRNGDGHLCVRQHADGVRIIVIDDALPVS